MSMTRHVFLALRARFHSHPTLRRVGRELFEGFLEQRVNAVLPYTEVNVRLNSREDTWDSDIETYDLNFRYHAKDPKTQSAADWLESMQEVFKDGKLLSGFFHCCGMNMIDAGAAQLVNSKFDASARFQVIVQRRVPVPSVRYA